MSSSQQWSCNLCTFQQSVDATRCAMCNHLNPHSQGQMKESSQPITPQHKEKDKKGAKHDELLSLIKVDNKGWNVSVFQDMNSTKYLLCDHCKGVCCDAVELGCNHNDDAISLHCKECLQSIINDNNNHCPVDNHPNPLIIPSRSSRKTISKKMVICPYSATYKRNNQQNNSQKSQNANAHVVDTLGSDEKEGFSMKEYGCSWRGPLSELILFHLAECTEKKNPAFSTTLIVKRLEKENTTLKQTVMEQKRKINMLSEENKSLTNKLNDALQTIQSQQLNQSQNDSDDNINWEYPERKRPLRTIKDEWDARSAKCTASQCDTPKVNGRGKIVTKTDGGGYDIILTKKIVFGGTVCWKFKVSTGAGFKIGIWKNKYGQKPSESHLGDKGKHCYVLDVYSGRLNVPNENKKWTEDKSYGNNVKKNGIIIMCLDFNALTLSFNIEDVDYGVAFANIENCKYRAAVELYVENDTVEIL